VTTPWLAYASLAGSMALVGSYVGLSKLLIAVFPVLLLAWLRFAIAGVAMLPWLKRQPGEPPLSAANKRLLFSSAFACCTACR
jgi:drug/metabolite transporter (DMT)-like permease